MFVWYNCQNNEPVFYCVASLYMLYLLYFLICCFAVLESSPGLIPFNYHASSCLKDLELGKEKMQVIS